MQLLRFRNLGKFGCRGKALEHRREQGMSICGTARGIIQSCQIESCAQLETARLLLLRNGDCRKECRLGRRGTRRVALEQNLAPRRRWRKASLQCSPVSPARARASSTRVRAPAASSCASISASKPWKNGTKSWFPWPVYAAIACRSSVAPVSRPSRRALAQAHSSTPRVAKSVSPFSWRSLTTISASCHAASASPRMISKWAFHI
jgi:hypothetical protein